MSTSIFEAVEEARHEWRVEDYVRFVRHHWPWLLAGLVIGWMAAFIIVSQIPNRYQARTRVLIERYTDEPVRFAENLPASAALRDVEFLATEYQLITSRPVIERVLSELNLAGFPPFSTAPDPIETLTDMIHVTPVRGTKLADIVAVSRNPTLAMRIANTTAQVYAKLNLDRRKQQTTGGVQWLREEVIRTATQMKATQEALQQFKESHKMVSLEDRQNVIVQRLTEISSAATEAKTARVRAEAEQTEIERAIASGTPVEALPIVQQSSLIKTLKEQISAKEGELADRRKVYGELHPTILQLSAEVGSLRNQLHQEAEKVVDSVRLEWASAKTREEELQRTLAEQERLAMELNRLSLEYNNLNREAQVSGDVYNSLATRLKELEVAESLQTNNVRIIDDAKLPERPVAPNRLRFLITGAVLGFLLGCGIIFLREALTTTVRTRKDVEELLNLPFLGRVLRVPGWRGAAKQRVLFFVEQPSSVAAEGMRAIRTTLEFLLPETPKHRLLLTSSFPEEGKSFVSANLAMALQELGRPTVLIDADMRRPTIFRLLQVPLEPGLSTYLEGHATLEEIVHTPPGAQGLTIITSGAIPRRPADLLAGPRLAELLDQLSATFQYIILDTPPVLAVADSTVLSRFVDGAILVVRANHTTRDALLASRQQLTQTPLKFLATVLNDVRPQSEYGYRYSYYYQSAGGRKSRRGRDRSTHPVDGPRYPGPPSDEPPADEDPQRSASPSG